MKVTIKKSSETKGMITKTTMHILELWVDLTQPEKDAITKSGMRQLLLEIDEDANKEQQYVTLVQFMKNSGPSRIEFSDAFSAKYAGDSFKDEITNVANAIKAYQNGDITGEESFEL